MPITSLHKLQVIENNIKESSYYYKYFRDY